MPVFFSGGPVGHSHHVYFYLYCCVCFLLFTPLLVWCQRYVFNTYFLLSYTLTIVISASKDFLTQHPWWHNTCSLLLTSLSVILCYQCETSLVCYFSFWVDVMREVTNLISILWCKAEHLKIGESFGWDAHEDTGQCYRNRLKYLPARVQPSQVYFQTPGLFRQ